ncbi:MAG: LTA synthase family protein [Myxococcales bacterium]|nr:LTA synthase family protein [Myxococcales bacterium]
MSKTAPTQSPFKQTTLAQLRLLVPGRAGAILVLLLWAWRIGAWMAREAFTDEVALESFSTHALVFGLLTDLALGLGATLIGRGAATVAIALGERIRRPLAMVGWFVVAFLAGAASIGRAVDLAYCYLCQCHFTAEGFLYLNKGMSTVLLTPRGLTLVALTTTAALLPGWALLRDSRRSVEQLNDAVSQRWVSDRGASALGLVAAIVGMSLVSVAIWDAARRPTDVYSLRLVPEVNLVNQFQSYRGGAICAGDDTYCVNTGESANVAVPPKTWAVWQKLGLVPPHAQSTMPFPMLRFGDGEPELPYADKTGAIARPNVVLTLMESVSGHFIHELSGTYKGLTPNLDKMAKRMTSVRGFYNTASPTVNAMAAILCSVHPSRHPNDLGIGEEMDGQAPMTCLADLLRRQGYRTVFIEPVVKTVTGIEYFMRTHGFEEVHGKKDILRALPGRPQGPWGPHDDTTREYIQLQIKRLEALRKKDGRPYLLTYITLDAHEPGMHDQKACKLPTVATETGKPIADVPADSASKRQLTAMYCTDKEMGHMADFLLDTPRKDTTLWAVTSDHALIRTPRARKILFKSGWYGGFAPLPFFIHDPRHELPGEVQVISGSTDIVPTLMHLLGGVKVPNSLSGWSVFGRRKDFPFIVGRMGTRLVMMAEPDRKQEHGLGRAGVLCKGQHRFLHGKRPEPMSACELLGYFSWQDSLFRARRLLPASHFKGLTIGDVKGLATRQELNRAEKRDRETKRKALKKAQRLKRLQLKNTQKNGSKAGGKPAKTGAHAVPNLRAAPARPIVVVPNAGRLNQPSSAK